MIKMDNKIGKDQCSEIGMKEKKEQEIIVGWKWFCKLPMSNGMCDFFDRNRIYHVGTKYRAVYPHTFSAFMKPFSKCVIDFISMFVRNNFKIVICEVEISGDIFEHVLLDKKMVNGEYLRIVRIV